MKRVDDNVVAKFQMSEPLVTFVVPSIGRPSLHRALRSLVRMNCANWRAIVALDGGAQASDAVRALAAHDVDFSVVASGRHGQSRT